MVGCPGRHRCFCPDRHDGGKVWQVSHDPEHIGDPGRIGHARPRPRITEEVTQFHPAILGIDEYNRRPGQVGSQIGPDE